MVDGLDRSWLGKWGIPEEIPPVPASENSIINGGPAPYINKMYATVIGSGVRLTFAEFNPASPEEPAFRAAVYMALPDAAALADLIQRQLGLVEQAIKDAQARGDLGETP